MEPETLRVLGFLGISAQLGYFLWRRQIFAENQEFESIRNLPENVNWLTLPTFRVVAAICDTFIPSIDIENVTDAIVSSAFEGMYGDLGKMMQDDINTLRTTKEGHAFLRRGAINSGTHNLVARTMQNALLPGSKTELFLVFSLLDTSLGCFLLTGFPAPFQNLSLAQRTTALRRLRDSFLQPLRAIYQTFRRVTTGVFLSYAERGIANESWELLNYHPRRSTAKALAGGTQSYLHEKLPALPVPTFRAEELDPTWHLDADVVIVGSGAGGGVMAHELVKAGLSVIVLEKGGYHRAQDPFQQWGEAEAMAHTLERGGVLATKDGNIMVLAGSCVGGGTSINWSASFDLPEHVRKEWAALGLKKFASNGEYLEAYAAINQLMSVNEKYSYRPRDPSSEDIAHDDDPDFVVNGVNHYLWEAALAEGLKPERIRRNVKGCVDCGNCLFGCPYGAKQSTVTALLEPLQTELNKHASCAHVHPPSSGKKGHLTVIPHCYAERILQRQGEAVGIAGVVHVYDEEDVGPFRKPPLRSVKLVVTAKVVVASCGALHTPALLLRSGLKNRKIGKHLTLHPVVAAATKLPNPDQSSKEEVYDGYQGVGMGVVVKNIERPGAEGWGSAIETPPFHLSIFGAGYFWDSGLQLKVGALSFSKFCPFLAIARDHSQESNCIELDPSGTGEPVINYVVTKEDEVNLIYALIQECRLLRAAGSSMTIILHEKFAPYIVDKSLPPEQESACFEAWLDSIKKAGIVASNSQLFSAHQMGSCRMASSPDEGVVNPDCESWELKNLFLADASVFPTSLGINPMITVEAVSYMTSKVVMERLKVKRNLNLDPCGW